MPLLQFITNLRLNKKQDDLFSKFN